MAFGPESTAEEVTEGIDLSRQNWLVTGCNSGLGKETARVLALRGAHILGLARSKEKADAALEGLDATGIACELTNLESVAAAAEAVLATGRPLDGIIANAGIMALPRLQQVGDLELQFATNHLGHFALIKALSLSLTPRGRVVVVSSGAHHMAKGLELDNLSGEKNYEPWRMYGRSKLANVLFARALDRRLAPNQHANSLHPGVIRTNLARHMENPEAMFESMKVTFKSIEQGAATQCFVATHPSLAAVGGRYYSDCSKGRTSRDAVDDELAERLWRRSEELIA